MTTASAASGWAPEPMVPGPTRLCSLKARRAVRDTRRAARHVARRAATVSRPGVTHARAAWLTPARRATTARPHPGLVNQNAGMTEPSDQVDSMYCFT